VWNLTPPQRKAMKHSAPIIAAFLFPTLALYVGCYLWILQPWTSTDTFLSRPYVNHYRTRMPNACRIFFCPIEAIDKRLRPKVWEQQTPPDPNFDLQSLRRTSDANHLSSARNSWNLVGTSDPMINDIAQR
jgi:hypothetical protein